jgi:hypothetical protein
MEITTKSIRILNISCVKSDSFSIFRFIPYLLTDTKDKCYLLNLGGSMNKTTIGWFITVCVIIFFLASFFYLSFDIYIHFMSGFWD